MRVLHIYRTYFPDTQGGLEEAIRQICINSTKHDVENRILTLSAHAKPRVIKRQEADVYRFYRIFEVASCGVSVSALTGFRRLAEWADIIHYHFPWPFADFLHFISQVKKPSLVTYHSDVIRQQGLLKLYRPLMKAFLNSVNVIVPTTNKYAQTSPVLEGYKRKIDVIPIGIDKSLYPKVSKESCNAWFERLGDGFFLFVGVLRYYKGLSFLLQAIKNTDIKVVIAGSGPEEKLLHELADKLGLDNVEFLGFVTDEDKAALMSLARGVVFPSHLRSEAFGVTLVEGLMYGKPLISCEIGTGTSYVNEDGVTGYAVPPADPVALRNAMLKLAVDDDLVVRMGSAARERYERLFTGKVMGEAYFRLYNKLLAND